MVRFSHVTSVFFCAVLRLPDVDATISGPTAHRPSTQTGALPPNRQPQLPPSPCQATGGHICTRCKLPWEPPALFAFDKTYGTSLKKLIGALRALPSHPRRQSPRPRSPRNLSQRCTPLAHASPLTQPNHCTSAFPQVSDPLIDYTTPIDTEF